VSWREMVSGFWSRDPAPKSEFNFGRRVVVKRLPLKTKHALGEKLTVSELRAEIEKDIYLTTGIKKEQAKMSESKFPLIKSLGLSTRMADIGAKHDAVVVHAESLERVLSEGVKVFATQAGSKNEWSQWPTKSAGQLTVALEIKYPWREKPSQFFPKGYRSTFITIWHKDPCSDGSDNSCDWWGQKRKLNPYERKLLSAISSMESILDNRPFYPDHEGHLRFKRVHEAKWEWLKRRGFRIHPRWHIWHWRIQIVPLQKTWRWLFDRCCFCKKGFAWNESVIGNWSGNSIWHEGCNHHTHKAAK
jgi:hypothetical protein